PRRCTASRSSTTTTPAARSTSVRPGRSRPCRSNSRGEAPSPRAAARGLGALLGTTMAPYALPALVLGAAVVVPAHGPKLAQPSQTYALRCRTAAQRDLATARAFGVVVYRDGQTGLGVYLTETGALACVGGVPEAEGAPARNRGVAWL